MSYYIVMKIAIDTAAVTNGDLGFEEFEKLGECVYFGVVPREELFALAADCDAILVNKVPVDGALLDACPKIKYVGVFATGYNVIDIEACRKRGVTVSNVPNYSTNSVAQHVFALILSLYGKIPEYAASVAAGDWIKSKTFTYFPWGTFEVYGKTLGVLGYGNIGKTVAKIASAFGMNVVISTRTKPQNCPYKVVSLEDMLGVSDIVTLHCPQTPATEKIINEKTISLMKDGAILINTARGGVIDEYAVRKALDSGKLSGVGVDVLSAEPMSAENPLYGAKNCIITPHIAWVPQEARIRLLQVSAENLRKFIEGNPQNVVS